MFTLVLPFRTFLFTLLIVFGQLTGIVRGQSSIFQLEITAQDKALAFEYLDRDHDNVLNKAEVSRIFRHYEDASPTINKFIALIDGHDADKDISQEEMNAFIDQKPVTGALEVCACVWSKSLKRQCFEDRIISFVHLVLPNSVISELYSSKFEHDGENNIGVEQLKGLFSFGDDAQQADETSNFLREIGGADKIITQTEFTLYVKQRDLHYEFRSCLKKNYDLDCLKSSLIRYTRQSLTEMNIAMIYKSLLFGKNTMIEPSDLLGKDGCNPPCNGDRFLTMLDCEGKDSLATYAEFRNFVQKHTVKIRIERRCTEAYVSQTDEVTCFRRELFKVVGEHHWPIWLSLGDADMLFFFEVMDADNDGQIEIWDDLIKLGYPEEIAEKFIREMDGKDKGKTVSLREFNEYVREPCVVYALAGCRLQGRGRERSACYKDELKDFIGEVLEKNVISSFFGYYEKGGVIDEKDLKAIGLNSGEIELFLNDLGQGDDLINFAEFKWFVRQEEISVMFKSNECGEDPLKLHAVLLDYLKSKLTEINIQSLFSHSDYNSNGDIEVQDWRDLATELGKPVDNVEQLIEKMDIPPEFDKLVNFEEFRLFLMSAGRKEQIEKNCIIAHSQSKYSLTCFFDQLLMF